MNILKQFKGLIVFVVKNVEKYKKSSPDDTLLSAFSMICSNIGNHFLTASATAKAATICKPHKAVRPQQGPENFIS